MPAGSSLITVIPGGSRCGRPGFGVPAALAAVGGSCRPAPTDGCSQHGGRGQRRRAGACAGPSRHVDAADRALAAELGAAPAGSGRRPVSSRPPAARAPARARSGPAPGRLRPVPALAEHDVRRPPHKRARRQVGGAVMRARIVVDADVAEVAAEARLHLVAHRLREGRPLLGVADRRRASPGERVRAGRRSMRRRASAADRRARCGRRAQRVRQLATLSTAGVLAASLQRCATARATSPATASSAAAGAAVAAGEPRANARSSAAGSASARRRASTAKTPRSDAAVRCGPGGRRAPASLPSPPT